MVQVDDLLVHLQKWLLIQASLEDVVDGAIADPTDFEGPGASCFEAVGGIFTRQAFQTEAGPIALFRVLVPRQDFVDELTGCRSDGVPPMDQFLWRPFGM